MFVVMEYFGPALSILSSFNLQVKTSLGSPEAVHTNVWFVETCTVLSSSKNGNWGGTTKMIREYSAGRSSPTESCNELDYSAVKEM